MWRSWKRVFALTGAFVTLATGLLAADLLTPAERQWLDAHGPLRYAPDPQFPPFEFFRPDGRLAGISPEILGKVARNLGTTIRPVRYGTWPEVLEGFQQGEADLLATLTRTPEREAFLDYSSAYLSVPNVLIVNSTARTIRGFVDLAGKTVGVAQNSGAHSWLRREHPEVMIRPQRTTQDGLRALSLGELDAVLDVLPVAGFVIAEHSYTHLRVLPEVIFAIPQHLAVGKGNAILLGILEKGLASVSTEERLQVFSRWTGEDPAKRALSLPPWFWRAVAVLGLAVAAVVGWNYSLRRLVASRTRALEESEGQFRALLEQLPVAAAWADAAGRVEFVNQAFTAMFGYTRDDVPTTARWFEHAYPDEVYRQEIVGRWRAYYERVRPTGRASEPLEARITGKDGRVRTVMIVGCEVAGKTVAVFEDITERARMELQLRQAQKMEAIGQLAGGVAHDFNNLLTVIRGHCGLMMMEGGLPVSLRDSIVQISEASDRAANLTQQLLTFSRKQAFRPRVVDLGAALEAVGKMLTRLIGERIVLNYRRPDGPVLITADSGMLEQVIVNLAVNARDAMAAGGRLTIGVEVVEVAEAEAGVQHPGAYAGRFAKLTVLDTGQGFTAEAMRHLFEPFFTTKEVGHGTGLGLATVYGIVQLHKGWIEMTNRPGEGAEFGLYFPVADSGVVEVGVVAESPLTGRGETILLVEDEPAVRTLMRRTLVHLGYRVVEAENASDALRVWAEHRATVQLLVTDMVMPGSMSGRELAEQLQREQPGLPAIVASGYTRTQAVQPEGEGTICFLAKPFETAGLARAVRRAFDRRPTP